MMHLYVVVISRHGTQPEDLVVFTVSTIKELKSPKLRAFIEAEARKEYPNDDVLVKILEIDQNAAL